MASLVSLFLFVNFITFAFSATVFQIFDSAQCVDSTPFANFTAQNGYPNGSCSLVPNTGSMFSFRISNIDSGCEVSLYPNAPNNPETACNGIAMLGVLDTCYLKDGVFTYYKIDNCATPIASSSPIASSPTTSSLASAQTSTPSSATPSTSSKSLIVGLTVGLGVPLLLVVAGFIIWRCRQLAHNNDDAKSMISILSYAGPGDLDQDHDTHQLLENVNTRYTHDHEK